MSGEACGDWRGWSAGWRRWESRRAWGRAGLTPGPAQVRSLPRPQPRRGPISVQGRAVGEFLGVAVERPVLDEFEIEVGCAAEDRVEAGLAGDDREERDLHLVDEARGHQRPVQRQAAV